MVDFDSVDFDSVDSDIVDSDFVDSDFVDSDIVDSDIVDIVADFGFDIVVVADNFLDSKHSMVPYS